MRKLIALAVLGTAVLAALCGRGRQRAQRHGHRGRLEHGRPVHDCGGGGFQKKNKGARVTVGISGTGGGFERFCRNETDLSNASRPMKIAEAKSTAANAGVKWIAFTVANDGLSIVVNKQNTWASCLTVAELKKIWEPGSKVNNWNESGTASRTCR